MKILRDYASDFGVCVAKTVAIASSDDPSIYSDAIVQLKDNKAKVILCFCEGLTIQELLKAIRRHKLTNEYLLIGRYAVMRFQVFICILLIY